MITHFIGQFASAFTAISTLCVSLNSWDLSPPTPRADHVVDSYNAVHWNRDDDRRRADRQWITFEANETESAYG